MTYRGPVVTVKLDLTSCIIHTHTEGSVPRGRCICCGAQGWVQSTLWGIPYNSQSPGTWDLRHNVECPLNEFLDEFGKLKEKFRPPPPPVVGGYNVRWWQRIFLWKRQTV